MEVIKAQPQNNQVGCVPEVLNMSGSAKIFFFTQYISSYNLDYMVVIFCT